MKLYLGKHHIGIPPHILGIYKLVKFPDRERLHGLVVPIKIRNGKFYYSVFLCTAGYPVFEPARIITDKPVAQRPALLGTVPDSRIGLDQG